jgi:hypothetical protein
MKSNMGLADKIIRLVLAASVALLYFTGMIDGTTALISGILALVFAGTAFLNFCPIYYILGISSKTDNDEK